MAKLKLVSNELGARAAMAASLGQQFGGARDMYQALGYKKQLSYQDYFALYERQDIAGRVVDMPAASTWRSVPIVKEEDQEDTPFEQAWNDLVNRAGVWHYLERLDKLAGVGRYAVMLIGCRDSTDLGRPLETQLRGPDDIIFLSVFSELNAPIDQWDRDPASPRFGKPLLYRVNLGDGFSHAKLVHYSRVIHAAEGLLEDEVYGKPRLQRVFNRLQDLEKVVGGSAEMFWQGAFRGLHADIDPEADLPEEEVDRLKGEIDEFVHGLRRYIRTRGMKLDALPSDTPDPRGTFEVLMALIAGASGIPKRVLLGSERGELASTQDETNYNSYIAARQEHYAEPIILRPFVDRLLEMGALPEPKEYEVEWPNLFALSDEEKAKVNNTKADTISKYARDIATAEEVVPLPEFREKFLDLDPEPSEEYQEHLDRRLERDLNGPDDVDEDFKREVRGE